MSRGQISTRRAACAAIAATLFGMAPSPALATDAAEPFSAPRDGGSYGRALECLTQAIYYEARSESLDGQRAVAQVVLNRVRHPAYPNTVCGVVFQGSHRRTGCQFSFTCDGSLRPPTEAGAWATAQRIATAALGGYVYRPVGLSLNYHTTAIRPYWAPSLVRHAVIGAHIFYRQPGSGSLAAFAQEPSRYEPAPGTSVAPVARASRVARAPLTLSPQVHRAARLEMATVERARVERPVFERAAIQQPPGFGARAARRPTAGASAQRPGRQVQPAPAAVRRGPRTSIEGGVRVSRGS